MSSFGILDFALPFGALALALLGWMGVSRLSARRAQTREAPAEGRAGSTPDIEPREGGP